MVCDTDTCNRYITDFWKYRPEGTARYNNILGKIDNYLYVDPVYSGGHPAWFLKKEMGSRESSTQISSIFRPSGKIKSPNHRLGTRTRTGPSPQFQPVSCPHNIMRLYFA